MEIVINSAFSHLTVDMHTPLTHAYIHTCWQPYTHTAYLQAHAHAQRERGQRGRESVSRSQPDWGTRSAAAGRGEGRVGGERGGGRKRERVGRWQKKEIQIGTRRGGKRSRLSVRRNCLGFTCDTNCSRGNGTGLVQGGDPVSRLGFCQRMTCPPEDQAVFPSSTE